MSNLTNQENTKSKYQSKNNKNSINLRSWTLAWVVSMAITAFAPKYLWDFNTTLTVIMVLANLAFGFGMLMSNRRYLLDLDEMQQKILFDAMAFTLGVGLVVGLSYELMEDIKLISFEPEIPHLIIIMCLTYLAAIISGHRKYR
jgi:hypothetical protein